MDPERWQRVKSIFEEALELPDDERAAFLDGACDDTEVRHEVESLLESHDSSEGFLEGTGARELVAAIVSDGPEDERVGQRFGPYRIVRRLGGGMGAVFLATRDDGEFQRQVAIKIVRHGTLIPEAVRHFRHERQILADLDHPNIARLLDGGTTAEGVPFFLMEYIEGEPLTRYCDVHQLGIDERLRLLMEVCSAVEFAHDRGVIHRDLKPGNILVTEEGVPKLLDFGVAKLLQTGSGDADSTRTTLYPEAMTPRYASPEQLRGERITAASDVYSLGVLLYELLTGRPPYSLEGLSPGTVEERVCEVEPLAPNRRVLEPASSRGEGDPDDRARARNTSPKELQNRLRGDLDRVVLKALRKRPEERYGSPAELAEDLERVLAGEPVTARAHELTYRLRSWGRRLRPHIVGVVVALAALAVGYWSANRPSSTLAPMSDFQHVPLVTGAANEEQPRISPDATRLAYLSDRGGERRMWLHDLESRGARPASPPLPQGARDPIWAPDGGRLGFLWVDGRIVRLAALTPGADGFEQLGAVGPALERPALVGWTGEGIYLLRAGALWHFDPSSGRQRRLTPEGFPHVMIQADVSHDGRRVVFTAAGEGASSPDLWISGIDGSRVRPLRQGPALEESPRFRGPDSRKVVYVSNASDQMDVWEIDTVTGEMMARTISQEVEDDLDVSADGRLVVFQRTDSEADLHVLDPVTGNQPAVTENSRNDSQPLLLDGERILFHRGKPEAELGDQHLDAEIHVTDLDGLPEAGTDTKVSEGFGTTPSPDGRWLAFVRYPGGTSQHDFQLVARDLEAGTETAVCERFYPGSFRPFPISFSHANLAWSPDGRGLYFISWADGGGTEIERIDREALRASSDAHTVFYRGEGRVIHDIRFSPAGHRMAWLERPDLARPQTVVTSSEAGSPVRRLPLPAYVEAQLAGWLDADTLVVIGIVKDGGDLRPEVMLLEAGSETPQLLGRLDLQLMGGTTLDRRRRTIYFTGEAEGIHNLYALHLDDGEPRRLTDNRITTVSFAGVTVLPDGRLLFSRQTRNRDLWMLRLAG